MSTSTPLPVETLILLLRGQRVIIDSDLAALYRVTTKRLNEQVRRNHKRFPKDFRFQLTKNELAEVVANCDHLEKMKYSAILPHAFTEHGAVMAASVLNTPLAIEMSVQVVRAFVQLRRILAEHREFGRKLAQLERRYEGQFKIVFDAIRQLMQPPKRKRRSIGFRLR
ncbi:MAG TPA: ORF6N domain-containing protein [Candidatus Peribacteraceae bacterium]|nr:ORF6N domain-containing protein [Candidatus Peribacteraceae bacterium]